MFVSQMLNALKISRNQHILLTRTTLMMPTRRGRRIGNHLHLRFLQQLTAMLIIKTTRVVESLVAPIVPHLVLVLSFFYLVFFQNSFLIYHTFTSPPLAQFLNFLILKHRFVHFTCYSYVCPEFFLFMQVCCLGQSVC